MKKVVNLESVQIAISMLEAQLEGANKVYQESLKDPHMSTAYTKGFKNATEEALKTAKNLLLSIEEMEEK